MCSPTAGARLQPIVSLARCRAPNSAPSSDTSPRPALLDSPDQAGGTASVRRRRRSRASAPARRARRRRTGGSATPRSAPLRSEPAISLVTRIFAARTPASSGTRSGASMVASCEPEQLEERLSLDEVQTGDGDEPVRRLEAAVVRVHRHPGRDLGRARTQIGARGRARRALRLAGEPDEILYLHRQAPPRAATPRPARRPRSPRARTSAASTAVAEQEAGAEVGHRDAAGAHRHVVARATRAPSAAPSGPARRGRTRARPPAGPSRRTT